MQTYKEDGQAGLFAPSSWSNVPGAFSSNKGNDFRAVIDRAVIEETIDIGAAERSGELSVGKQNRGIPDRDNKTTFWRGARYTMKYIIMKAQEAREFENLGGLTITKSFKPALPYIEGRSLEQTDDRNWRLVDGTGRPIEPEDGAADYFVPPVQSGDIVYIREPWTRLKNPDPSNRIRLATDSVVSEGQQA